MAIQTITFHKRSTGKTGQVLASPQIEAKLAKVERLYHEYHGTKLGRVKFYDLALQYAREAKSDIGSGYLQYTTQAIAGIFLDQMHKELGKQQARARTAPGTGGGVPYYRAPPFAVAATTPTPRPRR